MQANIFTYTPKKIQAWKKWQGAAPRSESSTLQGAENIMCRCLAKEKAF